MLGATCEMAVVVDLGRGSTFPKYAQIAPKAVSVKSPMANHCKIIPGYQAWTGVLDINSTGDGQSFAINAYLKNGSTPDSGCFFASIK